MILYEGLAGRTPPARDESDYSSSRIDSTGTTASLLVRVEQRVFDCSNL